MRVGSEQNHRLTGLVAFLAAALLIVGCSGSDAPLRSSGSGGSTVGTGSGSGPASGGSGAWGGAGGTGGAGGWAGSGASGGSGGDGGGASANGLPCNVKTVVDARCAGTCHGSPPAFGAPMSLVTWQDFQRAAPKDTSIRVYQSVTDRIHRSGTGRMPETGSLSSAEMGALDAWIAAGTPPGDNCGVTPPTNDGGGMRDAALPDAPTDEDTTCVEFRAHGQQGVSGDKSAFDTSTLFLPPTEFYACFNFTSPWKVPVQGLQFATIIDNSETLHHWLFYQTPLPVTDGSYIMCDGQHPLQALVTGWAPGNQDLQLPPDVGLELAPPTGNYVLELHYNNPAGKPFQDASGVRICASTKFRPKTASITWTGTEKINVPPRASGSATGKCVPGRINMGPSDPINIFAAWPHMHKTGTRMSTFINRVGGAQEVLIDKPFTFSSQVSYPTPAILNPGDTLQTTCYFDNMGTGSLGFGPSTTQEMCYDFLYAYPAHALDHPNIGPIVTSAASNLCVDN
ncbi:MAG TPA: hypothetical protein VK550_07060 [Polyangiaceae bacterium]|nr:hypothetical protein [Polyangiaceae bacterium]